MACGVLVPKRTVFVPLQSFSFSKAKKANRRNHHCRCQHTPRVDSCRNKNGSRTICAADYADCLHPHCIEGSCRSNRNSHPHPCSFQTSSPCCVLGNHCTVSAGNCQACCQPRAGVRHFSGRTNLDITSPCAAEFLYCPPNTAEAPQSFFSHPAALPSGCRSPPTGC